MHRDLLRLKNIGVKYERREGRWKFNQYWALKDVSFNVKKGELIGVIGRNGAGKSTLLRLLAGIYRPDKGRIEKGYDYTASLLALNIGFVAHLSGRENVVLNALLLGLQKAYALSLVEDIKAFSDLGDYFEQPIITYSTGMKARLGFSIAYHADPDLILIDEALGVGDKEFKEKSRAAIIEKLNHDETTVVITSHSIGMLKNLCHRVVWLEHGTVYKIGEAKAVIDEYSAQPQAKLKV